MDREFFVQNTKKLCAVKGVKPTITCRESGAGKDLINRIESGGSVPSVEKVQMLANYLGVTTSELLGEVPIGTCTTIPDTPQVSLPTLEVASAYDKTTPELQAAVRRVLDLT